MAGLVSYGSSDEDDIKEEKQNFAPQISLSHEAPRISLKPAYNRNSTRSKSALLAFPQSVSKSVSNLLVDKSSNGEASNLAEHPAVSIPSPVGPVLGPTKQVEDMAGSPRDDEGSISQSPYSANRAALRDLTLPTVPNYDIPPSPPVSPIVSTNAKFKHFLDLKRKGVHFNDSLSKSMALKNPGVMQQLMDFSDIDEAGQYATILPKEFWDSTAFPEHAYKEGLSKSQQRILKKRENDKAKGLRDSVDFVPATGSGETSRSGTPKISQKSTVERIMAGLDRGQSSSPQAQGVKRKSRFES
jgi:hypothetical protein